MTAFRGVRPMLDGLELIDDDIRRRVRPAPVEGILMM